MDGSEFFNINDSCLIDKDRQNFKNIIAHLITIEVLKIRKHREKKIYRLFLFRDWKLKY